MTLPHFGGPWNWHPILDDDAKDSISKKLKMATEAFENTNISLNGNGENIVYISNHYMNEYSYYKEEIIENYFKYIVYRITDDYVTIVIYTHNGIIHRYDKPAYIKYYDNEIGEYAYLNYGRLHRIDGPATIQHLSHEPSLHRHWINDKPLTNEEFIQTQRKKKLKKLKLCQKYS